MRFRPKVNRWRRHFPCIYTDWRACSSTPWRPCTSCSTRSERRFSSWTETQMSYTRSSLCHRARARPSARKALRTPTIQSFRYVRPKRCASKTQAKRFPKIDFFAPKLIVRHTLWRHRRDQDAAGRDQRRRGLRGDEERTQHLRPLLRP